MKQVIGTPRPYAPHGGMSALPGTLFLAAALTGCGGPVGTQSTFAPAQSTSASAAASTRARVQPQYCVSNCVYYKLRVKPKRLTIPLNHRIILRDEFMYCERYGRPTCNSLGGVDAAWTSSGGSLKAKNGGKRASFSASSPGIYTVAAKYGYSGRQYGGQATVTVTSP
jgi:hypothetical protein